VLTYPRLLTVIGCTHLIGGLLGLGGFLLPHPYARLWPAYWYVVGVVGYGLSVASGLALLRRRPSARRLAAAVEGLQLLAFNTGRGGFVFYSGLQALVYVSATRAEASVNFQSMFGIGPAMVSPEPFLAVDAVTLVIWMLLWRSRLAGASATPTPPGSTNVPITTERAV
jgi:hypothetical protein